MISHVYEIIGVDYDIRCNFVYFLSPAHAHSNAGPGPLKSGPEPSVPPAHADACNYFLHYLLLQSVHNTSVLVTFDHQTQVVSRTDFPNTDRSIRILGSTSAALLAARPREISILSHHHSKKYQNLEHEVGKTTLQVVCYLALFQPTEPLVLQTVFASSILHLQCCVIEQLPL